MAAPEHVPTSPTETARTYSSPARRPEPWAPVRPADFAGEHRQPEGLRLGSQGPDQGYAILLARLVEPELQLTSGEHPKDAIAGVVAVAMKRASAFGRAPVIHDLRVAATVFGFLDAGAPDELVRLRRHMFEEVGHFHHYMELREIADTVPEVVLRRSPAEVQASYLADWRSQLILPVPG